jgi:cytochrome P450
MKTASSLDIDFAHVDQLGNRLLGELDRFREEGPVLWSDCAGAWIVTRYDDVTDALAGKLPLSSARYTAAGFTGIPVEEHEKRIPILSSSIPHWAFNLDPPDHVRLRRLLTRAFSRQVVKSVQPFAQATIDRILASAPIGEPIEFVDTIARAITGRVILRLFGLPEELLGKFQFWSVSLNEALGVVNASGAALELAEQTLREMKAVLLPEIEARRRQPTDDFLSQLVEAHEDGDRLSEEEVMGICYVALIAGHDTTMNSMALGVDVLVRFPEQIDYLLNHPDDIVSSVMEVTRLSAMSTGQSRLVTEDFSWHGAQLRKGDYAMLMMAAANRDPRRFAHPAVLDLSRDTSDIVTFGPGLHHCIGHLLAKMQLGEFFTRLFSRYTVEVLDEELAFIAALSFRGLETMHVRLTPR